MSEANKLLDSLTDDEFAAYSDIGPVDDVLYIDAETRTINVPNTELLFGVETDKDVERKYFKCPRIVGDNVDLSKKQLRVHYQNASGTPEGRDKYIVEDVKVVGDYVTFSWKLSKKVLAYKGTVHFTIVAVSVNADGSVNKEWNTTLASGNVLEGLEVEDLNEYEEEQARDVLLQLLAMLETEKDNSIDVITRAGTSVKNNVTAEGVIQVNAVAAKGAEVLASIPKDYTDLNNTVKQHTEDIYDLARAKANAIVGEVVGETIYVQDAAEQPPVELSLFGKTKQSGPTNGYQLFDASKIKTTTAAGATVTNNGDGSFTITGNGAMTGTLGARYSFSHEDSVKLLKAGTLTLSTGAKSYPYAFVQLIVGSSNVASCTNINGATSSLEVKEEYLADASMYMEIGLYGVADFGIIPSTIKPMLYQDGDGTWERFSGGKPGPNPEYPFELENVENPTLYLQGANLANIPDSEPAVYNGLTWSSKGGAVTVSGTSTGISGNSARYFLPVVPGTYYISGSSSDGLVSVLAAVVTRDGTSKYYKNDSFTLDGTETKITIYCQCNAGVTVNHTVYPMVNIGKTAQPWKKYGHLNTVELPYTLRGLPVTAGGNMVDSSGQMWCGDEIDFEQGVLNQRILHLTYDGSLDEDWHLGNGSGNGVDNRFETSINDISALTKPGMYVVANGCCDTFMYKHSGGIPPVNNFRIGTNAQLTIAYALFNPDTSIAPFEDVTAWRAWLAENPIELDMTLREPIVTPLTEEQLAAYRELLMNNPITTLYNSAGAPMRLRYSKDTALCIGTKTDEITLSASKWVEQDGGSHYTQVVSVSGISANTRIDLNPTPEQLISIVEEGLSMFAANQNGVVTVYAMGGKPASDMTLPIAKQEVVYV